MVSYDTDQEPEVVSYSASLDVGAAVKGAIAD